MNYFHSTRQNSTRRGSIYLAVMGVAMIVSLIGMATMSIARLQLRSSQNLQNLEEAKAISQSGIEFGMGNMEHLSDWRTDRTHGIEMSPPLNLGNGTMTYALVDLDEDLADDPTDRVRIRGIGRVGEAVYVTSVLLEPSGVGLTSLETSMHSGGDLERSGASTITTNQMVSSNGDIDNAGGSGVINGDAWAAGNISGSVSGNQAKFQNPPKEMPDPATVFEYYVANGTRIPLGSIPSQTIHGVVISPGNNPYGSTVNPLGIYVIDCQDSDLVIREVRIQGTLVLLNAGSGTVIDEDIHWEPAAANFPALLVEGDLEMKWHAEDALQESLAGVNFNPANSPYQGIADSDMADEYSGVIRGLIYVSGDLEITYECRLEGVVVVGGDIEVVENLTLIYNQSLMNSPPPGFSAGPVMRIVPGTWTRIPY